MLPHTSQFKLIVKRNFKASIMTITQSPLITGLVRENRERLDPTQEQFAAKLAVSYQSVNTCENRRNKPLPVVMKLSQGMLRAIGNHDFDLLQKHFAD